MRTVQEIKDKREKLRNDVANLEQKWRELYYINWENEDKEEKKERWKNMDSIMKNKERIKGQIEAITFMLNEDYEMSEIDENLSMRTIIHGDWRDKL